MEWLKKILEGATITEGKLDIEAVMKQVNVEFPKNAVPKETYNTVSSELKTANITIEDLKKNNGDNETLQKTIKDHEATIQKLKDEASSTAKSYTLKEALKEAGVKDVDYLIFKHGGVDKFTFDKDSKVIGLEETIKPYKENEAMAHLFTTGEKKQDYNPSGGKGGSFANPWAKETFNLTEQGKIFKENPAQAKELAQAAGVNL